MTRRDLLRLMLATAAAEAVDFEKLLWTPKTIVTVPAMPDTVIVGIIKRGDVTFRINWQALEKAAFDFWMSGPHGKLGDVDTSKVLERMNS